MPNGLRMNCAFDPAHGAVRMAADVDPGDNGFLCEDCGCAVSWVRDHTVRGDHKRLERHVPAFFRLMPDAEHAVGCRHTLGGQIVQLVRESRAVEDAADPFEDRDDEGYIFRINIPRQEVQALRRQGEVYDPQVHRERAERVWAGPRLAPYCRSAVGLAKLWALIDQGHADLRNAVTIQDQGNEIRWEDFFYPPSRYPSLAHRIETKTLSLAAAALLVVHDHGNDRRGSFIEGAGEAGRTRERSTIAPRIYVPENLQAEFEIGSRFIVFGTWGSYDKTWEPNPTTKILFRNLTMQVYRREQFCRIDLPVEGEDE